jgi:hypothetical protein
VPGTQRKPRGDSTPKQAPRSAKRSALGIVGVAPSGISDIVGEQPDAAPERTSGRAGPTAPSKAVAPLVTASEGRGSSIYLRSLDIDRVNEIEEAVRRAKRVGGKIGLSLIVRAGVRVLAEEFRKSEEHGVDCVVAVSVEEQ